MESSVEVLVIGGGVLGLTSAYFLARSGARVAICDRGAFGRGASWAGAGIIPPGNADRVHHPYERLRAVSSEMFPALSKELAERSAIDNGYRRCGGLEILSGRDAPHPTDMWTAEAVAWERLSDSELGRLEPRLSPSVSEAYHFPAMAQVRNPWHIAALVESLDRMGVQLWPDEPFHEFERRGERILAAKTGKRSVVASDYLCCLGSWTDQALAGIGVASRVRPVRGQIVLLKTEKPILSRIILEGKRYLVPREDGRVLVGSTEEEVGFHAETTADEIERLRRFAVEKVPDLAGAVVEKSWAGLRPGSHDGFPTLGRVPGLANLWVCAGHFRSGIQLSPASGLALSQVMRGEEPIIPLEAFALDRRSIEGFRPAFQS